MNVPTIGGNSTTSETPYATTRFGLDATHGSGYRSWRVENLIRPGLRRNPRRAHLWVSTVLGKHIPVAPSSIFSAADDLGDLAVRALADRGQRDGLVFGFAETATGLGHAVARRIDATMYLQSTRRNAADVPVTARFEEGHSHATDHLIVPTDPAVLCTDLPVVLVDDEISTGATALDAIRSMHEIHPRSLYVVASLVDMRTSDDIVRCEQRADALETSVHFVSLAQGATSIPPDLTDRVLQLPAPSPPAVRERGHVERLDVAWPSHVPDGGRYGFSRSDWPHFDRAVTEVAQRVVGRLDATRPTVVIGHEELMYLPQRIAAELSVWSQAPVLSQTTTRSPAHVIDDPTYPLRRGYHFQAPEPDDARDRYLYNATHDHDGARVVMIVDSPADTPALSGPGGLVDVVSARGDDLLLVVVPATDYRLLCAARTGR